MGNTGKHEGALPKDSVRNSRTRRKPEAEKEIEIVIHQEAEHVEGNGMTGLKVEQLQGEVTIALGNVVKVDQVTPEMLQQIMAFGVSSGSKSSSRGGAAEDENLDALKEEIAALRQSLRDVEKNGQRLDSSPKALQQHSRAELLLKQALLCKAEADQLFAACLARNAAHAAQQGPAGQWGDDQNPLLRGLDTTAYMSKLQEAYALLTEARQYDATNPAILLNLAIVMNTLKEGPDEVAVLLAQVQEMLSSPRNDAEKLMLGQALCFAAVTTETPHPEQINKARDLFTQVNRQDLVIFCDQLLVLMQQHIATGGQAGLYGHTSLPPFQPVGNWQAQLANGGTMTFTLYPNGMMQGMQTTFGMSVNFQGRWGFNPYNQWLHLEGVIGGFAPFVLQLRIQGQQANFYQAFGSDGFGYQLRRF